MIQKLSKTKLIITHKELKTKTKILVSNEGINKTFLKPIKTNTVQTPVKTFLPIFEGFYNTIWDYETIDFENENNCTFDELVIDDSEYNKDIVLHICEFVKNNCEFITAVDLEEVKSPKEYNFYNDSANVTIDIDSAGFKKFIYANVETFETYFKNHYTSCDGFISRYENTFEGWKVDTNNFLDLDGHFLGALLDCYFEIKEVTELDCYYENEVYIDSYITIERKVIELNKLELVKQLDFSFGYFALIYNECLQRSNDSGINLYELLLENNEVLEAIENLEVV